MLVKLHASHVGNIIILLAKIRPYSWSFLNGNFIILKIGEKTSWWILLRRLRQLLLWKIEKKFFHLYNKRN